MTICYAHGDACGSDCRFRAPKPLDSEPEAPPDMKCPISRRQRDGRREDDVRLYIPRGGSVVIEAEQ